MTPDLRLVQPSYSMSAPLVERFMVAAEAHEFREAIYPQAAGLVFLDTLWATMPAKPAPKPPPIRRDGWGKPLPPPPPKRAA